MNGILLLPIAGLLFLGLAGVEWALYRLEQNEVHLSRTRAFGASSLGLLVVWGAIAIWSGRPAPGTWAEPNGPAQAMAPEAGAPPSALTAPLQPVLPALKLAGQLLHRQEQPTLEQVRAERAQLLEARRTLATLPIGSDQQEAFLQEADTVLGVAYTALGDEWQLARSGAWGAQALASTIKPLQSEWAKWENLQACLGKARHDGCVPLPARTERSTAVYQWQRTLRLYLLDCLRFDEEDPDLAWLPPAELRSTRERLAAGRSELAARPLPEWGAALTAAANQLFVAADQALRLEETITAQGQWNRQTMVRAYQPVKTAWDQLFERTACALDNGLPCPSRSQ